MRFSEYLTETVKTRTKFTFDVKKDKASWYNNPGMRGERIAIETIDMIEDLLKKVVKTKKQKLIASLLFDYTATTWNYFVINVSKSYINKCSYILRRIDKQTPYELYVWHKSKTGIMKTEIDHILEYLSYMSKDNEEYLKWYTEARAFYGLDKDEARKRFDIYHKSLEKFDYIKLLKSKWR